MAEKAAALYPIGPVEGFDQTVCTLYRQGRGDICELFSSFREFSSLLRRLESFVGFFFFYLRAKSLSVPPLFFFFYPFFVSSGRGEHHGLTIDRHNMSKKTSLQVGNHSGTWDFLWVGLKRCCLATVWGKKRKLVLLFSTFLEVRLVHLSRPGGRGCTLAWNFEQIFALNEF